MNKQVILNRRPIGMPVASDFLIISNPLPKHLSQGEVLVQLEWTSIDPAQRVWISGTKKSYFPPVALNEVIRAYSIGKVLTSTVTAFKPGTYVSGLMGWQEYCIIDHRHIFKLPSPETPHIYLGVLGLTGLTAYIAIVHLARPLGREVIVVSSAAGSVGSIACQLAKMKGCKVIGIVGTDQKCEWLVKELKVDVAINYKKGNLAEEIKRACPDGVDIYIDNVGGEVLDAVVVNIKKYARIVMCGSISAYNLRRAPCIRNYSVVTERSATMIGFIVNDYKDLFVVALKSLTKWIAQGKLKYREQFLKGLEAAPEGLAMLLSGENYGKLLVQITNTAEKL